MSRLTYEFVFLRCFGNHILILKLSRKKLREHEIFTEDCFSGHSTSRYSVICVFARISSLEEIVYLYIYIYIYVCIFFFLYILSGFLLQRACESQDFGMLSLYQANIYIACEQLGYCRLNKN